MYLHEPYIFLVVVGNKNIICFALPAGNLNIGHLANVLWSVHRRQEPG